MTREEAYMILGIGSNSSSDEIKSAYRKLARIWHPDINKSPNAEAEFKKISEAYEILTKEPTNKGFDLFGTFSDWNFTWFDSGSSSLTLQIDNLTAQMAQSIVETLKRAGFKVKGYSYQKILGASARG